MPAVAEAQAWITRALIGAEQHGVPPELVGGTNSWARFAIHARNYEASLMAALSAKFPATAWLAGSETFSAAVRAFLHARPPQRPCIAEYGADFPEFLASFDRARALPYLRAFAELEWAVAQVSIAVDRAPLSWSDLVTVGTERLLEAKVALQDGVRYVRAAWRVDELMKTFLQGAEPERFELDVTDSCIEVRGSRGAVAIEGVEPATFAFRACLAAGRTIESAAGQALGVHAGFDVGDALRRLVHARLAVELHTADEFCIPRRGSVR
jgi:hypothetical protein